MRRLNWQSKFKIKPNSMRDYSILTVNMIKACKRLYHANINQKKSTITG